MRELTLAGRSRPLLLHEATPEALRAATANFERPRRRPFGLACWPAARVLAEALLEMRPSASIVELGAGTGLVSLAAAAGGLRCVATDVSDAPLALLRASAAAQSLRVPTAVFDFTSDAPLPSPAPTDRRRRRDLQRRVAAERAQPRRGGGAPADRRRIPRSF